MSSLSPAPAPTICGHLRQKRRALAIWRTRYCGLVGNVLYSSKCDGDFASPAFAAACKALAVDPGTAVRFDGRQRGETAEFALENAATFGRVLFCALLPEALAWVFALRMCNRTERAYSLDHFRVIRELGRGFFGLVTLVEKLDTGELFALKAVAKRRLREAGLLAQARIEREILCLVPRHPFIVGLQFAFQTDRKFFLGLEYVPGGELLHHLNRRGALTIDDFRLYLAELVLALEHLHACEVVYRDLKPENVLLDDAGHVKLADFGLSKRIADSTSTVCGTAEYIAPEVLKREPYGFKVDWWALGVLAYVMMFGYAPFSDESEPALFEKILTQEPEFPVFGHQASLDFMRRLLVKDPDARMGAAEVRAHRLFAGLNWDRVLRKGYRPEGFRAADDVDESPDSSRAETPADSDARQSTPMDCMIPGFSFGPPDEPDLRFRFS
jgi:serine/threonine protein kinase